jgi:hypothetical protein
MRRGSSASGTLAISRPIRQGFDLFFRLPYSNDMDEPWYPGQERPVHGCNSLLPDCRRGVPVMEGERILEMPAIQETLTKRYTERAIEFMRGAVAHGQAFFLYYASHLPHVPLYASDEFLGRSAPTTQSARRVYQPAALPERASRSAAWRASAQRSRRS